MSCPLQNRVLAAIADVPRARKPHFGAIARQLKIRPTELTVAVLQLVEGGKLDRDTLRPPPAARQRPNCQLPGECAAGARGPCKMGCERPAERPSRREAARTPQLTVVAAARFDEALVWCGQCDRRVPVARAVGCASPWCKAELPPEQRECKL